MLSIRFHLDGAVLFLAAAGEEVLPAPLAGPVVDDLLAVDKELGESPSAPQMYHHTRILTFALPAEMRPNLKVQSYGRGFRTPSSSSE